MGESPAGAADGVAYVVGTFDTKGTELRYVAALLADGGATVTTVDLSTSGAESNADVPAAEVASWHPDGPSSVFTGDRGSSVTAMATAFERYLVAAPAVAGVLGLGGSGGTAIVTQAMRALPVGIPKLVVSTVASGDVSNYVDASDLVLFPSVTDIAGLNRISRSVLSNAAHALLGMISNPPPPPDPKPSVALTMFGVTTPCATAVAERVAPDWEPLVFHATGTGGRAMEKLVLDGVVAAVVDITTTEISDLVVGGVMSAGPQRLDAIAYTGIPYVGSCGALDMVNFGAEATVPREYADRQLYVHNPQVTLMRTTPEECARVGRFLADKLNACTGPVRFLLPEGGVSLLDAPGQPFHDPEADAALFSTVESQVHTTPQRQVVRVPYNVNDPEFAEALVVALDEVATPTARKGGR